MAAVATDYNPATYTIDDYVIQREVGLWVVEQTIGDDGRPCLVVYNSATTLSDETEAISLPDGLKFAWVLVRQVVSVAVRRAFHRKGVVGRGRSAS